MLSRWTQNLDSDEDKEEFSQYIRSSKRLLNRLNEILTDELTHLETSEITTKTYESPNWTYLQAHKNGYRQCLGHIMKLTTLDPTERTK